MVASFVPLSSTRYDPEQMVAPGTRIGRYELGARLGTGGFGVVYLARDTELGRDLAIKVLRPEYQMQPDVVGRFLKEARAAAKIDHPGIVTVFECGHITGTGTAADGNAFIAMELLRGESLAAVLERRGRLTIEEAVLIARQIAGALGVAHAAGIVHRDLKPDNVFLIPDVLVRGGARVKVLDFGVAKLAEPKDAVNTHSQMMLGTPMYMSPEQGRSAANVDHRTDIYTLGCMLYEMVTGQPPYEGPGAIDLIIAHTTAPVPSPAAIVADMPRALDALITEMLAKDPAARPASMLALEAALDQAMLDPPKPAARPRPPTPPPPQPQPPARPSANLGAPPPRPSIAAPARPSAAALAPTLLPFEPSYSDELDGKTFTRLPPPDRSRTRRLLLVTGLGVATLAAAITWFALRSEPAPRSPSATAPAGNRAPGDAAAPMAIGSAPATLDPQSVRRECQLLADQERWDELKTCSERLAAFDASAARQLRDKAVDEATNKLQLHRLDDELSKKNFEAANTLVKRIPDDSVYKVEARRRLDEARALDRPRTLEQAEPPRSTPRPLLRDPPRRL